MSHLHRREFLAAISCSVASLAVDAASADSCWLDVCAPFVIENPRAGIRSEIILTSDSFAGVRGHESASNASDYEIYLYDERGNPAGSANPIRLSVPAMRTKVIPVRDLLGEDTSFWGGMKIRLRPRGSNVKHASDLFSSAFIRWTTAESFDNVHANPDPVQLQNSEGYYYSMPFPPLAEYECLFSLFNPNEEASRGSIILLGPNGNRLVTKPYQLKPHASLLFDLNSGDFGRDVWPLQQYPTTRNRTAGLIAVTNEAGSTKSFGYLMIRQSARKRFSVEHPIHQGIFKPKSAAPPFDAKEQFTAKNVLFTPLLFNGNRFGSLTFESRFHFGTGLPLEEVQWLYPFAADADGNAAWSSMKDEKLKVELPGQTERGVIRLGAGQSCVLDPARLSLPRKFSGGLGVAVSPDTTHTLLKVEIRVPEWDAFAFTHFRPGLGSARRYQTPDERGRLATDYIASGARLERRNGAIEYDEIIAIMNIDDQGLEARPILELFGPAGRIEAVELATIPGHACRHFLLSDLVKRDIGPGLFTLRLIDERATLLMSIVHIDHTRRDIALDHGSDRFSTFVDYPCR